jgi:two-component system phosphate regulon response regulator PhoB
MHVLFVDDTHDLADLFRVGFTAEGHTVEIAHDAFEALPIIVRSAQNLDVIILDYQMPHLTGVEVAKQLQQVKKIASIPVILFTGAQPSAIETQIQNLGLARVAYKPMMPSHLMALAQQVVDESRLTTGYPTAL